MSQFVQPAVLAAEEGDYAAIVALVTDGLVERWGWHDTTLNPDLASFSECYRHATVVVAKQADRIVGCGVLIAENDQSPRIGALSRR